jgi:Tfp pilus assembly protein PilF
MSLLMDALDKVEQINQSKQPDQQTSKQSDEQTTDSFFSTETDEELLLTEITDNEIPISYIEQSTLAVQNEQSPTSFTDIENQPQTHLSDKASDNEQSLKDFKEIQTQQHTTLADNEQQLEQQGTDSKQTHDQLESTLLDIEASADFSLIDWQPSLQNDEADTTSHLSDDDFLPQYQDKLDKDKGAYIAPHLSNEERSNFNDFDLSDFDDEQQLIDSKNENTALKSSLIAPPNQSASLKDDRPDLKNTGTPSEPEFQFKLEAKDSEISETEQTVLLDENKPLPQFPLPTTITAETLKRNQTDFEFKLKEKSTEETEIEPEPFNEILKSQNRPHPEAARRVLAATAAPKNTSQRTVLLTGVLMVLLISMGSGYYYYSQSSLAEPLLFKTPRPPLITTSVSPTIEKTTHTEDSSTTEHTAILTSSTIMPLNKTTDKTLNETNQGQPTTEIVKKQSVTEPTVNPPVKTTSSQKATTESVPESKQKVVQNTSTDTHKKIAEQQKQSLLKPQQKLPHSPQQAEIKELKDFQAKKRPKPQPQNTTTPGIHTLRKNQITQSINQALSTGYDAFQRGNDSTALRSYLNVLRQDENNRDALFGLAALALRNGNKPQAQDYYRRILQRYPQDKHAQVGLINSLDNHNGSNETQLKMLLEQTPESAYIHFSLGNFYASKERWAQAQSAYFNAYRYDKAQADYAYNLAISLDQLNQPRTALVYYQQALQQSQNQAIHFNPETVRQRIQTIKQHTQPSALEQM